MEQRIPAKSIVRIVWVIVVLSLTAFPCDAKMYKYQKDGVWHFTDSPPREVLEKSEVVSGVQDSAPAPSPEGTPLLIDYPTRNEMEKVAAATVAVKSSLGYGSGFFITNDGYILTNKHVIRTTSDQVKEEKEFFDDADGRIKEAQDALADEKNRLAQYAAKLQGLKHLAENEKDSLRKKSYEDEHAYRSKTYNEAKVQYENRARQFESEKKNYLSQKSDYEYSQAVANLSQSVEIILADNIVINARLVATSVDHDLALLKIDGYQTPMVKISKSSILPGLPLFAVGNPARLQNSVTSGIFSGYEKGFIKTNAQIYPGNSGGPLVTTEGHVVGVNTFKQLTHKYEGLGFAIPISRAFEEFGKYLR
jgi:serine protease Do